MSTAMATRQCPTCDSAISRRASVCPFCRKKVTPLDGDWTRRHPTLAAFGGMVLILAVVAPFLPSDKDVANAANAVSTACADPDAFDRQVAVNASRLYTIAPAERQAPATAMELAALSLSGKAACVTGRTYDDYGHRVR